MEDRTLSVQLFDLAGKQDKYDKLTKNYFQFSDVVMLVYDCSDRNSFTNLKFWNDKINDNLGPEIACVLIANKIDLDNRQITKEEGETFAKNETMQYYEVSAKSGEGIMDMFSKEIARKVSNERATFSSKP